MPTTPLVTAALASLPGHDDRWKARLLTAAVAKAAQTPTTAPTGMTVVPLLGLANVMSPPYTPTKVTASHMAAIATAPQISDRRHHGPGSYVSTVLSAGTVCMTDISTAPRDKTNSRYYTHGARAGEHAIGPKLIRNGCRLALRSPCSSTSTRSALP